MNCPNCGKSASLDQKYCRSCGMTLSAVSKLVTEHLSGPNAIQARSQNDKAAVAQMAKGLLGGIISLVIGMAMLALGKTGFLGVVGLIFVLAAVIAMAYAVLSPMWKTGITINSKNSKGKITDSLNSSSAESPAQLLEDGEPVLMPSVTEHTTEILVKRSSANKDDSGDVVSPTN